jgi:hypothetical protein
MEVSGQLHRPVALSPGKELPVRHRRVDGPQSRPGGYGEKKNLAPPRNRTPAAQTLARRYTDRVFPGYEVIKLYFQYTSGICTPVGDSNTGLFQRNFVYTRRDFP